VDDRRIATSRRSAVALLAVVGAEVAFVVAGGATPSPLAPPLPGGVAPPAWASSVARALGLDRLRWTGASIVGLSLLAVATLAWGALLAEAHRARVGARIVVVASAVALGVAVAGPLLFSRDVYSYAAYGRIAAVHDGNPYLVPPSAFLDDPFTAVVSSTWIDQRAVYGPAFVLVATGVAAATEDSPAGTVAGFKLLAGVAMLAALLLAVSAARRLKPERAALVAVATGIGPVTVLHVVGGAHVDALVAAWVAAGLWFGTRWWTRSTSAGDRGPNPVAWSACGATACLTLAALTKAPAGVALLLWLAWLVASVERGRRARTLLVHAAVVVALAAVLFAPLWAGWRTLAPLAGLSDLLGWASGPGLVGRVARAGGEAVGSASLGRALVVAVNAAFLGLLAVVLWRTLLAVLRGARRTNAMLTEGLGTGLLLVALCGPYLPPWYPAAYLVPIGLLAGEGWVAAALGTAGVLALTGVPAEPGPSPDLYSAMLWAVHWVAAAAMLAVLAILARRLLAPSRAVSFEAGSPGPGRARRPPRPAPPP
jgi:hypothetical protein